MNTDLWATTQASVDLQDEADTVGFVEYMNEQLTAHVVGHILLSTRTTSTMSEQD